MTRITWFSHAAFSLQCNDVTVLIDPFLDGNPTCQNPSTSITHVDLVLVTHDHADHTGQAVELCNTHKAMLGTVVGTAQALIEQGLQGDLVLNGIGFNMGGTVEYKGVHVTMIPAFHTSESGQAAGFIIRMPDGLTIYHAGDTCIFGDMALWGKLYPIDVALLPIGGVFTMDAEQAAHAAALLNAKRALPMHFATFPVIAPNATEFESALNRCAPQCQCITLAAGQSVDITT